MKKRFSSPVTRMHSSRMCTVHCSSRMQGGPARKGVCPGGVCTGRVSAWGLSAQESVCLGVSAWGASVQGRVCRGRCLPDTHPPCGQNDRQVLKHYLAANSLRTVRTITKYLFPDMTTLMECSQCPLMETDFTISL